MSVRVLRIPRAEARALLKRQIELGTSFLEREISNEDELATYVDDRKRYNQVNCQTLEYIFGEVIDAFWRYGASYPPEWEDFEFRVSFYKKWDREQVNELRGYEESLDLVPEAIGVFKELSERPPSNKKHHPSTAQNAPFQFVHSLLDSKLGERLEAALDYINALPTSDVLNLDMQSLIKRLSNLRLLRRSFERINVPGMNK